MNETFAQWRGEAPGVPCRPAVARCRVAGKTDKLGCCWGGQQRTNAAIQKSLTRSSHAHHARSGMPLNLDTAFDTAAAAGITERGPPRRMCRRNVISPQAIGEISGGVASATRAPTTCPRPTLRATPDPGRSRLPTPPPAVTPGVGKRPHRYGCAPGSREQRCSLELGGKGVVVSPARVASGHHAREQRYELRPRGRSSRRQLVHLA